MDDRTKRSIRGRNKGEKERKKTITKHPIFTTGDEDHETQQLDEEKDEEQRGRKSGKRKERGRPANIHYDLNDTHNTLHESII